MAGGTKLGGLAVHVGCQGTFLPGHLGWIGWHLDNEIFKGCLLNQGYCRQELTCFKGKCLGQSGQQLRVEVWMCLDVVLACLCLVAIAIGSEVHGKLPEKGVAPARFCTAQRLCHVDLPGLRRPSLRTWPSSVGLRTATGITWMRWMRYDEMRRFSNDVHILEPISVMQLRTTTDSPNDFLKFPLFWQGCSACGFVSRRFRQQDTDGIQMGLTVWLWERCGSSIIIIEGNLHRSNQ